MARGMLAIWSDVEAVEETDYLHWLAREHTAERVGIEGFEGVRVFRADLPQVRRYLILYDLAGPAVLASPAYRERLDAPTPWSRRVMPRLQNFARGGGAVVAEAGAGRGGYLAALRLDQRPPTDDAVPRALAAGDRICAARLLDVDAGGTGIPTNEKALRAGDASFPGLLLVEALDAAALRDALASHADALRRIGAAADPTAYSAAFGLEKADLRRGTAA